MILRPRLEICGDHGDVMRFSRYKNVAICAWRGQANGPSVETLTKLVERLLSEDSERFSFIHIIPNRVRLPDSAARLGMIRLMKDHETRTACAAIVVGGSGFWASAMRNAVIGLRVLVPRTFEYRLHASTQEVLEWLPESHRQRTGITVTAAELEQLLSQAEEWQTPTSQPPD